MKKKKLVSSPSWVWLKSGVTLVRLDSKSRDPSPHPWYMLGTAVTLLPVQIYFSCFLGLLASFALSSLTPYGTEIGKIVETFTNLWGQIKMTTLQITGDRELFCPQELDETARCFLFHCLFCGSVSVSLPLSNSDFHLPLFQCMHCIYFKMLLPFSRCMNREKHWFSSLVIIQLRNSLLISYMNK